MGGGRLKRLAVVRSPRTGAIERGNHGLPSDYDCISKWRANSEKFTCDGPEISPALAWTEPPTGTKSLAVIVDDPDAPAGTWVHWVLYDLPGDARQLGEGVAKDRQLPDGAHRGGMISARSATMGRARQRMVCTVTPSNSTRGIARRISRPEPARLNWSVP